MKIIFDPAELKPEEHEPRPNIFYIINPTGDERRELVMLGITDLRLGVEIPCEDQAEHIASVLNGFLERGGDTVTALEIEILPDLVRLTGRSAEENLGHTFFAADKVTE